MSQDESDKSRFDLVCGINGNGQISTTRDQVAGEGQGRVYSANCLNGSKMNSCQEFILGGRAERGKNESVMQCQRSKHACIRATGKESDFFMATFGAANLNYLSCSLHTIQCRRYARTRSVKKRRLALQPC